MIKVHVSGRQIYINDDIIECFSESLNYLGRTTIYFICDKDDDKKIDGVDETPDEIYELIRKERRKMYSEFGYETKELRVSC